MTFFADSRDGPWRVVRHETVTGRPLPRIERLAITDGPVVAHAGGEWPLRGVASHGRYVTLEERRQLEARQPPPGRPEATCAALIPLSKSETWWNLAQDERRAVIEAQSQHIAVGLRYLPAVARRLYHCRDLGEPFDFLTWFEYAPAEASRFEELVTALRRSTEWTYVEREVDIRLER